LKKLNESLTKNVDTSSSGMLRNDLGYLPKHYLSELRAGCIKK
jgi:hypothetical protein